MRKATFCKKPKRLVCSPDFFSRLIKIYRGKRLKITGAELVVRDRNRY
jgi:hypothetical protein